MKKFTFMLLIAHCSLQIVKADWVQVNNGLTQHNVNALCSYTSGTESYVFAGTLRAFESGVYLTTNNGDSWTLNWQLPNDIWALASTSGGGNNYVFAGTGNGMGYTSNNGANWYSAGLPHEIYSIAASGNYVFAGCKWWSYDSGGVYKSTNLGVNWVRTLYGPEIHGLAINGNYVFVGAGGGANQIMGIFKSTDYGQSWGLPSLNNRTFFSLAIIGNYIFAGSNGVYVSTNNGLNWSHTSLDSTGSIYSLAVYGNIIFAGGYVSGGGFLISTNYGITWSNRSEGGANGVRAICISNDFVFAGTDGGGAFLGGL